MNGVLLGIIILLGSLHGGVAYAQPREAAGDRESRFRARLEREWVEFQSIPDLRGHSLRYVHEIHSTLTADEAEEIRRRISTKPDHPDHQVLLFHDQAVSSGRPFTMERALFSGGDRLWRWSRLDGNADDEAMSEQAAWAWYDGRLEVSAPDDRSAPGRVGSSQVSTLIPEVSRFFSGGMGAARTANLVITRADLQAGARWTATAIIKDLPASTYVHVFEGVWSDAEGRGFVDRVRIHHRGLANPPDATDVVKDWKHVPELDRWLAHAIDTLDRRGRRERACRVVAIDPIPAPLTELLRVPSRDHADPIRGAAAITSLVDHRTGRVMNQDADGRAVEGQLVHHSPGNSAWAYIGWGTLAVIALGVLLYVRRSKAS